MGDILKEAIADAKAVRETALENAKIALEEAFKPRIQSMLSAKLKEVEDEYEDEEEFGDDEEEFPAEEGTYYEDEDQFGDEEDEFGDEEGGEEKIPANVVAALSGGEEGGIEGGEEGGEGFGDEEEEDMEEEGVIEINGVKYAPVVSEEDVFESPDVSEDSGEEISNLDLEAIIRELESELEEDLEESDNPYDGDDSHNDYGNPPAEIHKKEKFAEGEESDDDAIEEKLEDSTEGDFDPTGAKKRSVDEPSQGSLKSEGNDDDDIVEIDINDDDDDDLDEELNSSGIGKGDQQSVNLSADTEDPQGPGFKKEKFSESVKDIKAELAEYKEAVEFLRDRLHEVNILNAKLLFTNKLFKEFVLDNGQKMKVVETFDRAQTVREIKLVYSTLAESFGGNSNVQKQSIKESAGASSKAVSSTKPKRKIISEEEAVANRFKKLAGLLNG